MGNAHRRKKALRAELAKKKLESTAVESVEDVKEVIPKNDSSTDSTSLEVTELPIALKELPVVKEETETKKKTKKVIKK